jgi:two-component system, chemotaxis family, sensor kinase CheA
MEGKETELDKTLIEAIKDPLTHIVRNSADHGIERPEVRTAAGKPAEGRLFLRAYHEGGQVNIEISDDGAGIAVDRVKRKAVDRGLITAEQAARMGEREALNLIFLPGLSTAEKITNVSGRGVGMDVVKTNLEKIGGAVDIQSQVGKGTTLKIKIPLTLAIIPALIVTSAGERYAIPQISLLELVRLEGDEARKGIESIHGAPVYRLRGNLLPLAYLNHELGLEGAAPGDQDVINIVVLHADDRQFGLVVDAVNDTEEIVVKPLGKQLKGLATFAGATIMGDGRVALILDVLGLAHRAKVISEVRERTLVEDNAARQKAASENRQTLLLLRNQGDGRIAIPLGLVTRLEEFPRSAIEKTGNQTVVQYRDSILPLVCVADLLQERRRKTRGPQEAPPGDIPVQVVVYTDQDRSVGLVVDRILDIVEEDVAKLQPASREGVQGCLAIQGRVTEILDLEGLVRTHAALRSTKDSLQKVSA